MFKGQIPIFQTGRRKATSRYCLNCQAWHDTPRGLNPQEECQPPDRGETPHHPAILDRTSLGDVRRANVKVPIRPDGSLGRPVVRGVR